MSTLAMTERELQAWVTKAAAAFRFLVYHTRYSLGSAAGFPDVCLVQPYQGRVIFAELKRDGKRPTEKQAIWLAALRACPGVETYLWTPSQMDEILEVLRGAETRSDAHGRLSGPLGCQK